VFKKKLDLTVFLSVDNECILKFFSKIRFFSVYLFCFITKKGLYVMFLCVATLLVVNRHFKIESFKSVDLKILTGAFEPKLRFIQRKLSSKLTN
jgi:hypothetical protein